MKNVSLLLLCLVGCIQANEIPSFIDIRNSCEYAFGASAEEAARAAFNGHLMNVPLEDIEPTVISWFKECPALYAYANGDVVLQDDSYAPIKPEYITSWESHLNEKAPFKGVDPSVLQAHFQAYFKTETYIELTHLRDIRYDLQKQLDQLMPKPTYVDGLVASLRISAEYEKLLPAAEFTKFLGDSAVREQEILRVLKNMGIKQAVSDEQTMDLLVQLTLADLKFLDGLDGYEGLSQDERERKSLMEQIKILYKLLAIYE